MRSLHGIFLLILITPLALHSRNGAPDTLPDKVRIGGDVRVDSGTRFGSAIAIGGNLRVDGYLRKDAVAIGGSVTLGPNALVEGNAVAIGGRLFLEPGALVRGDRTELGLPWTHGEWNKGGWRSWPGTHWPFSLLSFLGFVTVALILAAVLPEALANLTDRIAKTPGKSFLLGLLGAFALPLIVVLLAISLVGILLIPFLFLGVWLAFLIGYIAVARWVGRRILQSFRQSGTSLPWETVIGVAALWVVGWVPFLGWVIKGVVSLVGFGAVIGLLPVKRNRTGGAIPESTPI